MSKRNRDVLIVYQLMVDLHGGGGGGGRSRFAITSFVFLRGLQSRNEFQCYYINECWLFDIVFSLLVSMYAKYLP